MVIYIFSFSNKCVLLLPHPKLKMLLISKSNPKLSFKACAVIKIPI